MAIDREAILEAVALRLRGSIKSIRYVTRSPVEAKGVSREKIPVALVLLDRGHADRQRGHPPRWTFTVTVDVWAKNMPARDTSGLPSPDTQLNALEREIELAFERQGTECVFDQWHTTLGGLVERCWVVSSEREQGQENSWLGVQLEILALGK